MRERDIHSIIEEQNPEEKHALYEELQLRLNLPDSQTQVKPKRMKKSWIVSLVTVCVCALCLVVVLPIVLTNDNNQDRYCQEADYQEINLSCTLKEHSEQNNKNLLYVHWYDIADEVLTYQYVNISDPNDEIFLKELIVNSETGDIVRLYVCDSNPRVDVVDFFYNACTKEYTIKNVKINWNSTEQSSLAMFEYQGYRYYLEIDEPNRDEMIKEIIEEMLG